MLHLLADAVTSRELGRACLGIGTRGARCSPLACHGLLRSLKIFDATVFCLRVPGRLGSQYCTMLDVHNRILAVPAWQRVFCTDLSQKAVRASGTLRVDRDVAPRIFAGQVTLLTGLSKPHRTESGRAYQACSHVTGVVAVRKQPSCIIGRGGTMVVLSVFTYTGPGYSLLPCRHVTDQRNPFMTTSALCAAP